MSLAIVHSRAQVGVEAPAVTVEVHMANGLPSLTLVGLPETAVKESKDRVRSAILNSALQYPARRITLNLAPADLPKDGGRSDLAIALGILAASAQVPALTPDHVESLADLPPPALVRHSLEGSLFFFYSVGPSGRSFWSTTRSQRCRRGCSRGSPAAACGFLPRLPSPWPSRTQRRTNKSLAPAHSPSLADWDVRSPL
mgnify:CR=1 FL=1